jgi:hypothetical protein
VRAILHGRNTCADHRIASKATCPSRVFGVELGLNGSSPSRARFPNCAALRFAKGERATQHTIFFGYCRNPEK